VVKKNKNRKRVKKDKIGRCNICGVNGKLTEDHVPPKGSIQVTRMEMYSIIDVIAAQRPNKKGKQAQNGVKFKTLCGVCNNDRLGLNYDPAINQFSNEIASIVRTPVAVPPKCTISIEPNKVARAVVGHLLAVGNDRYSTEAVPGLLSKYFLDPTQDLPSGFKIYFWLYPYLRQVLIRDGGICPEFPRQIFVFFWLMKYFPLSFFVTYKEPEEVTFKVPSLNQYLSTDINDVANVTIDITNIPKQNWPEAPMKGGIVSYTDEAHGAYEKS